MNAARRDPTYARIASAVPRWVSVSLRDDVISDIYLAVAEGRLAENRIAAEAKAFASRAVTQFESRYGPLSLDQLMFDDSGETFLDRLADPAALESLDDILERAWA